MPLSRRSFFVLPICLAACNFERRVVEVSGSTMGTYYKVAVVNTPSDLTKAKLQNAVDKALLEVNTHLSNWDADSEISRFNAHKSTAEMSVSPVLAEVMAAAEQVHKASSGRFDTTITPLIELWGFGANGTRHNAPTSDEIAQAAQFSGHGNTLRIGSSSLKKIQLEAQVFLAAIGKGYGADRVGKALEELGVKDYMIEIGGDLYAAGRNADGVPWQIGVETPQASSRGVMGVVGITGLGMASSGDYRNYFEQDGVRYSHVIDPATGEPIKHRTASATVLAENGMLADAWATAMLILGREEGMKVADANNIAVMFIERDPNSSDLRFKTTRNTLFKELQA